MERSAFGLIYVHNSLPQHVVDAPSVKHFQHLLQQGLLEYAKTNAADWLSLFRHESRAIPSHNFQELFRLQ